MSCLYPYPCFALGKDLLKLCIGVLQGSVKICCAVGTGPIGSVDSSCVVVTFLFLPFLFVCFKYPQVPEKRGYVLEGKWAAPVCEV